MLQPTYFQQNQNSGTTSTKLLEERERVLNSLASLANNIETPTPLNSEGGYFFVQHQNIIPFATFFNASEGIGFVETANIMPITPTRIAAAPMSFYQPLTIPQSETLSLSPQETYNLIRKSFESYKKESQKYSLQRSEEIMSFLDEDDNE